MLRISSSERKYAMPMSPTAMRRSGPKNASACSKSASGFRISTLA
jgi:hypothetical protein